MITKSTGSEEITYREYIQRQRRGSDREGQILYDLTYMWNTKNVELIETDGKLMVARVGEWGDVGQSANFQL